MWRNIVAASLTALCWWVVVCGQPSKPRAKSNGTLQSARQGEGLDCGGQHTLHVGEELHITSRNYPKPYPRNHRCHYEFNCDAEDAAMGLTCSAFEIQRTRGCTLDKDFLRVYDGSGSLAKACGRQPPEVTTAGGFLGLRFVSNNDKIRRSGFNCTVSCEVGTQSANSTAVPGGATTPSTPVSNSSGTVAPSSTTVSTDVTTPTTSFTSSPKRCHCGEANFNTRIVGGQDTQQHEYPWQVGLVKSDEIPFCGGSLLNSYFVVTAAHCVYERPTEDYQLAFGEHDWKNATNRIQRDVDQVFIHPDYDHISQDYDITLLRVKVSVNILTFSTSPVCLPTYEANYAGQLAVATGWGATSEYGPLVSSTLQEVDVRILEDSECSSSYPEKVTERMQCAGVPGGGKDSCQGDSGGPLVVKDNGLYVLTGITSWGQGCGRDGKPGVYAKVQSFIPWIMSTMGNEQGCTIVKEHQTSNSIQITKVVDIAIGRDENMIDSHAVTPKQEMNFITKRPTLPCRCGPLIQPSMLSAHSLQNHPWTLSLSSLGTEGKVFCSGTIITTMNVLTAASCVDNRNLSTFHIRANEDKFGETSSRVIKRRAIKVLINNDIALLTLDNPISLTRYPTVKPACLPLENHDFLGLPNIHSGYDLGRVLATSGTWISNENPNRLTFRSNTEAFCGEDLGGPIISRSGDHNYLVGLAIDSNCGNDQKAAKVSAHYNWIMEHHEGRFCSL